MAGLFKNVAILFIIFSLFLSKSVSAQLKQSLVKACTEKQIEYSDLDSWYYREVHESLFIGGATQKLYEIGTSGAGNNKHNPLLKDQSSPWATTNLYAKIGADVGVNCVFPEKTKDGCCCRMETKIREVNLIGLKIKVLVAGTIFLGEIIQPVRSVKDPICKVNHGIAFEGKPGGVQFSYKYKSGQHRLKSVFSSRPVEGSDKGEFCMILQKRWEDENGNVYAIRIGGARDFLFDTRDQWVNDTTVTVKYGDITKEPFYDPKRMALIPEVSELYVKNSKNEMVPLTETGWDTFHETPTHLILYFTSSFEGVNYIGSPESMLWVDNIRLIY